VSTKITFTDHLEWRQGEKVVAEEEIDIVGSWQANPIRFLRNGGGAEQELPVGVQADGRVLQVVPGFLTYWHSMDVALFAMGALCFFVTVLIAGARWWWLLRVNGTDVSLGETLRLTWIGVFFNNVMLGSTGGDVVKALYIMKRCPGHRVQVIVSVIVDRVLGLASLALLAAVIVLFALDRFGTIALGIWGVIVGVGLLGAIAFSKRLRSLVRLKSLLDRLPHRVGHVLRLIDQAVFFYRDHKVVIIASLLTGIGNHVVSVLSVVLMGNALGVGMPTFEYFVLIPVINIISAVPLMPNGWGIGEAMYQNLFGTYGAPHLAGTADAREVMGTRGVALSVLYRLHTIAWSLLGGVFMLFERDKVTRADIEREAELESRDDERDDDVAPPEDRG
jgi:uncharacterized protein (TIRG00374 family)